MLTPFSVRLLLHYHAIAEPVNPSWAADETTTWFLEQGLIRPNGLGAVEGCQYITTKKGEAFVRLILQTPVPKFAWVDPRNNELILGE